MLALITYEGYTLFAWGCIYKSLIDDQWVLFDRADKWVHYIKERKI